ncbi:MAG TPA: autotransporter assembly complex family protein [Microvirga sp.]|nr:autotransporter assembly complex family protein [Microvirga sp.]
MLLVALCGWPQHPALAFDLFGLFGFGEQAPRVSREAVAYSVVFEGVEGDRDLLQSLRDVSTLYRLRGEAPPDGESLARRAEADLPRLTDALWGAGYYDGRVSILVDAVSIQPGGTAVAAAARRAEAYRGRAAVPVRIVVERGPLFRLRSVAALHARTGTPFDPTVVPPRILRVRDSEPARSATVLAIEARLVDRFRELGHPLVKVVRRDPVVDHRAKTLDVTFLLDPGPRAAIGTVTVRGTQDVDPAVVRSFIYTEPGDPYSPKAVAGIRRSVARIEALGSVRVREAEALDANGRLPLTVEVTERPPRLFGIAARYSTVDGPGVRTYWAHRNLFGGAERLRLDADAFFVDRDRPADPRTGRRDDSFDWGNLGARFGASFLKPALWGTRDDFLLDATVAREITEGYTSRFAGATAAIRHRFTDTFSAQAGLEVETGQSSDSLGRVDYTLVGLPVSATYDSTDNLLDPTEGVRASGSVIPYPGFLGSDPGIVIAKGQASTYYALDEEARYVLAGRVGFGSIVGAELAEIPSNRRFFAGGGGSVRGYEYRTLGPKGPFGDPIGGRSLLEGSVEARLKITDTIGIVPFFDMGTAFEGSLPDFDERIRMSAGLGLRYYTGIGPIRLDVAFPIDKERGDRPAAVYISLGQAF